MNDKFNAKDYEDLIKKLNPFGFIEPNGESSYFHDYGELYYYVMEKMVTYFPRGYIDIILFIINEKKITYTKAVEIFKKYFRAIFHDEYCLIELWNKESKERDLFFRNLLFCFHAYSDTKFSESYFRNAIARFNERNDKLALKERTIDGTILDPVASINN